MAGIILNKYLRINVYTRSRIYARLVHLAYEGRKGRLKSKQNEEVMREMKSLESVLSVVTFYEGVLGEEIKQVRFNHLIDPRLFLRV